MKTLLKNGTLVTADRVFSADLLIDGEKISAVGTLEAQGADRVIDVTGMYVMPGGIDPHTHMELQQSERYRACDDFYTGTVAAACGGTTTILDHIAFGPAGCNLHHSIDIYHELAKKAAIDYGFHGVIQHVDDAILEELDHIVREEGIPSFKAYATYAFATSDKNFYRLLKQMKASGGVLTIHCENDEMTNYLKDRALAEGRTDVRYFASTRPNEAEAESVDTLLNLAEMAGEAPVYIVHTSAKESIKRAKLQRAMGQKNIFVETCPQYLVLTDDKYVEGGAREGVKYLMQPPLRKKSDNEVLWAAIQDGTVNTIGTDHCPFLYATEKTQALENFSLAPGGAPGVEERMSLIFSEGVQKGRIDLTTFVRVMSTAPAEIFGMYPEKGSLEIGTDADIVVIDPNRGRTFSVGTQHSVCDYNTYEGLHVDNSIAHVFSRGRQVASYGEFMGEAGDGRFIHRRAIAR